MTLLRVFQQPVKPRPFKELKPRVSLPLRTDESGYSLTVAIKRVNSLS